MGSKSAKPISNIIFKRGNESFPNLEHRSLFEIKATDLDNHQLLLGDILEGKKCIVVVNVASKCLLSNAQYQDLV